jgi:hypothetical protein
MAAIKFKCVCPVTTEGFVDFIEYFVYVDLETGEILCIVTPHGSREP